MVGFVTVSRTRPGTWTVVAMAVLLLLPASSMGHPGEREGPDAPPGIDYGPIPTLSLQLSPSTLQAEVSQSELGSVTFDGTATVDMSMLMRGTVTLTAVVNTGWPAILSRQTIVFQGPGSEEFQATVVVPPATSALLAGNLIVTGSLKCPGLAPSIGAASAVVTVAPYYSVIIRSSEPTVRISKGETASFTLEVSNSGNAPTYLSLLAAGAPQDIHVEFTEEGRQVNSDEVWNVTTRVEVDGGADSGRHPVRIIVVASTEHEGTVEVGMFNLTVYVPSIVDRLAWSNALPVIIIVAVVAGILVVLWRKGKLPKGLKLPRLSRKAQEAAEGPA